MGSVLSFFKKEGPIEKVLEEMDHRIKDIEERSLTYRTRWRNAISLLVLYGVVLECAYLFFFYLWIFRSTESDFLEKALWGIPIFAIFSVCWTLKVIINFYYSRRVTNDELELQTMKKRQKTKLEEFAKATDFYKTRELLNRYTKTLVDPNTPGKETPVKKTPTKPEETPGLRHRNVGTPAPANPPPVEAQPAPPQPEIELPPMRPVPPIYIAVPADRRQDPPDRVAPPPDPNRPWYDKLIDSLVGDNPDHSSALICERCRQHNGIVPKEEMENIQFKCRSCGHFNEKGQEQPSVAQQLPTTEPNEQKEESEEKGN